jgi:BirA family biotin operon repressor/biotin-[acetyl-CoA-carboxylase] ligase
MNERELQKALASLPLGGLRYFETIGSTNDEALAWASQGAPDLSLVVADEQTAGRGRSGRKWFTPPGAALAFSLILRPGASERAHPARTTGLGALALTDSLQTRGLSARIKWPNDVLINDKKVAGILVESVWTGEALDASVLGMGVNVLTASVPPADQVLFPATSIESELGQAIDRAELFSDLLAVLIGWRSRLGTDEFMQAWEDALAFRGRQVQVMRDHQPAMAGELIGLAPDGSLHIRGSRGDLQQVQFGEVHLRPVL